jgi:hypothetical protein
VVKQDQGVQAQTKIDPLAEWRRWSGHALLFIVGTAAFGIAYTQWPLYAENQHTKFLHGLATAGYGHLRLDWLANTIDPLPAFSTLVAFTYGWLDPLFFYLYHGLLLGIYLFSLIGIMNLTFGLNRTSAGPLYFAVIMIALFAGQAPPFSIPVLGTSLSWLLQAGVANQYLINPAFQPSTFGVLLILSIYLFLANWPYWAVIAAALAAIMHSTYLPSAAVLTASYMLISGWRDRAWWRALALGLLALLLVSPVLLHNALNLGPTTVDLWNQAQDIIVNYRIPHHSLPEIWLDQTVYAKMAIVGCALLLVRNARLGIIMGLAAFAAVGLTLVELRWSSDTLAFIAPWRISTFLVPLSSATIIAAALAWLGERLAGPLTRFRFVAMLPALVALALLVTQGWNAMERNVAERRTDYRAGLFHFVGESAVEESVFLVPTGMAEFRLATGAPVLVTFKSHPYKDTEVIEWRARVDAANGFYGEPTCGRLLELMERFPITHVVLEPGQLPEGCLELEPLYEDPSFRVSRVIN